MPFPPTDQLIVTGDVGVYPAVLVLVSATAPLVILRVPVLPPFVSVPITILKLGLSRVKVPFRFDPLLPKVTFNGIVRVDTELPLPSSNV